MGQYCEDSRWREAVVVVMMVVVGVVVGMVVIIVLGVVDHG